MGIIRLLKRSVIPGQMAVDIVESVIEEKNLVKGMKKIAKETFTEDMPVFADLYNMGRYEGKKQGYVEASKEYEEKLLLQAEHFINQKELLVNEVSNYEELLDEYEIEIERLEGKLNKTESENQYLSKLLSNERKLKQIDKNI